MSEGVAMEDEFGSDAEEDFFSKEEMEDLVGAFSIDRNPSEDLFYGGDSEAGFGEGGFDLGFCGGLRRCRGLWRRREVLRFHLGRRFFWRR